MSRFAKWFLDVSTRKPLLTNCIAGSIIAVIGDIGCQKYEQKYLNINVPTKAIEDSSISSEFSLSHFSFDDFSKKFKEEASTIDSTRSLEMGFIRGTVITPFILKWYPTLVRLCPGNTIPRIFGRVVLDQITGGPICLLLIFMIKAAISGMTLKELDDLITNNYYPAWFKGLQYWPFVNMINFGFVPLKFQPFLAHFASVYWNAVLSYYANNKLVKSEDAVDGDQSVIQTVD